MKILIKERIGLNEIEQFILGLQCKFKSNKFKNSTTEVTRKDGKFIEQAMKAKLADEQCYHRELVDKKNKTNTWDKKLATKKSRRRTKMGPKRPDRKMSRKIMG